MATVQKWGNSLAVRIPAALAGQLDGGDTGTLLLGGGCRTTRKMSKERGHRTLMAGMGRASGVAGLKPARELSGKRDRIAAHATWRRCEHVFSRLKRERQHRNKLDQSANHRSAFLHDRLKAECWSAER